MFVWLFQPEDEGSVIDISREIINSKALKSSPSEFELLKVLGQGSFGKVGHLAENLTTLY